MSSYVETAARGWTARLPWRNRKAAFEALPGEQRIPFLVDPDHGRRSGLSRVRAAAFLCALAAVFALLSLSAPPARTLDAVAVGAVGISAFAVAMVLWLRAGAVGRARLAVLSIGALTLSGLAISIATAPRAGSISRIDLGREQWLLIIGTFLIGAFTIRHLVGRLQEAVA
jgi:hypothetical protein